MKEPIVTYENDQLKRDFKTLLYVGEVFLVDVKIRKKAASSSLPSACKLFYNIRIYGEDNLKEDFPEAIEIKIIGVRAIA